MGSPAFSKILLKGDARETGQKVGRLWRLEKQFGAQSHDILISMRLNVQSSEQPFGAMGGSKSARNSTSYDKFGKHT